MKTQVNKSQNLIKLIRCKMVNSDEMLKDLAQHLGISYIHMTSLMGGARSWSGLKQHKQRLLAKYLGISLVEFYRLSGFLSEEDFHSTANRGDVQAQSI